MASQNLLDEFDSMGSTDYRSQLGIVGLQKIIDEDMATSRTERRGGARVDYAYDDFPSFVAQQKDHMEQLIDANEEVHVSDDSLSSLVDKIRAEIYEVKITNALHSIVLPLAERLEGLHLEDRLEALNNHREDVLYQQEIVAAIKDLGNRMEDNFVRRLILEYRQFMRNPVWNSMRLLNKMVISPVLGLTKTLLFGRKKQESDTDRIVRSVNELTEFMRTGMIDREKTFTDRLLSGGLVGAPLKALTRGIVSATTGISTKTAQERENALASGSTLKEQNLLNNFKGFVSNMVYGGDIIRRGRQSGVTGELESPSEKTITDLYELFEQSTRHESETTNLVRETNAILSRIERFGYEQTNQQRMLFEKELEKEVATEQQNFVEQTRHASVIDLMKADHEYQQDMWKLTKKDHKINKNQLDEAEETNRRLFMQNILKGLGIVTSGIGSLVKSIGSLIGTMLGGKALTKVIGGRRGRGGMLGGMSKTKGGVLGGLGKMGKGFARRIPILGTLLGAGALANVAMADDMTTEQKTEQGSILAGGLAGGAAGASGGAAAGAAIGSVVPVVGTAVGGAIGGILGGAAGMFLGEEAVKPFKEEVGEFVRSVGDSVAEAWDASKDYTAEKWNQVSNWFSENIPAFGDMLSNIPDKLSSVWTNFKKKVSGIWDSFSFDGIFGDDSEEADAKPVKKDSWIASTWDSVTGMFSDDKPVAEQKSFVDPRARSVARERAAREARKLKAEGVYSQSYSEVDNIRDERNLVSGMQGERRGFVGSVVADNYPQAAMVMQPEQTPTPRANAGTVSTRNNENRARNITTGMSAISDGEDRSSYGAMKAAMESFKKSAMEDKKMTSEEINILRDMLAHLVEMNKNSKKSQQNGSQKSKVSESFNTNAERSTMASVTSGE